MAKLYEVMWVLIGVMVLFMSKDGLLTAVCFAVAALYRIADEIERKNR